MTSVNNPNVNPMKIDQTLHGYDDGHRLIEQSFSLSSRARHTVLHFSDRSVDSNELPELGYITGYPLTEENLYVLSRTWPAKDMPRPGCVWTHSLYITFTDLARIEDATSLLRLFQKPAGMEIRNNYATPIEYFQGESLSEINSEFAEKILKELYLSPEEQVILKVDLPSHIEETLVSIWSQQWPRLKRNFRFCSLTSRDRSTSDHPFDLQIVTHGSFASSIHIGANKLLNDTFEENSDWLDASLADLLDQEHGLRKFLKRVGGDIEGGRERFAELCELYWNTQHFNNNNSTELFLDYVTHRLSDKEGKLLRKQAIELAVKNANQISEANLMVILPFIEDSISKMPPIEKLEFSKKYWNISPNIFMNPESPQFLRDNFNEVVKSIPIKQLNKAVRSNVNLLLPSLRANTKLAESVDLWKNLPSKAVEETINSELPKALKIKISNALLSAGRVDVADVLIEHLGADFVFNAVLHSNLENFDFGNVYLSKALDVSLDADELVTNALKGNVDHLSKADVYLFSKYVSPRVPISNKNSGEDIWVEAWNTANGEIPPEEMDDFQVFLVERALIFGGNCSAAIFSDVFDRLHDRLGRGLVDYERKSQISHRLAPSDIFDWSYQGRFIRTVANQALQYSYNREQILSLSQNSKRRRQIVRLIGETKKGRAYIKKVIG